MSVVTVGTKKALAAVVISGCLGFQTLEIFTPHQGRLWPFIDYPMYSQSFRPPGTFRTIELRSVSCDGSGMRQIEAPAIGQPRYRLRTRLRAIAADEEGAAQHRIILSRMVAAEIEPRPCELQVWERSVNINTDGVDPSEFTAGRWTMRGQWLVQNPQ